MASGETPWQRFWDRRHRIYANDRHRLIHFRKIAQDIIGELPHGDAVVLDFGCGDALDAARVARFCGRLLLCESAPTVRRRLQETFRGHPKIAVIAPDELGPLGPSTVDLIVMNSVSQYMTRDELDRILEELRLHLRYSGRLLVGDVVPPNVAMTSDVMSLLQTAVRGRYLLAALGSLVATFFSDYRRLRRDVGLTTYDDAAMISAFARAGYTARRRSANLGFHPRRVTYIATRNR